MMEPDQSARLPGDQPGYAGRTTLLLRRALVRGYQQAGGRRGLYRRAARSGARRCRARYPPNVLRDTRSFSYTAGRDENGEPGGYFDIDENRHRLAGVTMADCGNIYNQPGTWTATFGASRA
jgi:hypothetical protein